MAPTQMKKLIALQSARGTEIESMHTELNDSSVGALSKNNLLTRIEALKEIWFEVRQTHAEIIVRDDIENEPYVIDNKFNQMHSIYQKLLDALTDKVDQLERINPPSTLPSETVNLMGAGLVKPNLPKLDLPKFSGKYEDWESFSDLFNTLVHSKIASDATKFSYLKLCLTGPAADLVKDVATTDANYATTWQALSARFFNPRLVVNKHLHALTNLPHLKGESAADLRLLADEAQRIVRALSNLKMPVDQWDVWLIYVLASRLDPISREKWESELSSRDQSIIADDRRDSPVTPVQPSIVERFPKFSEFIKFLEQRSQTLSMMAARDANDRRLSSNNKSCRGSRVVNHARQNVKSVSKCALCSGMHPLFKCHKLKAKTPYERRAEIRRLNLCFNCFGRHRFQECRSQVRCVTCGEKHHSLLHFDSKRQHGGKEVNKDVDIKRAPDTNISTPTVSSHVANISENKYSVILATAQLIVQGPNGFRTRARALLDQGSEVTIITESIAQLVGLPKKQTNITLLGVGATNSGNAKFLTSFTLRSIVNPDFQLNTRALILPRLTSYLPSRNVMEIDLREFEDLSLADPQYCVRDTIDIILGADVYAQLLRSGLRTSACSGLIAQDTALGWVISGPVQRNASRRAVHIESYPVQAFHNISNAELNDSLQRFWDINELPDLVPTLRPEDEKCEQIFRDTYARSENGRFTVHLPLKTNPPACAAEMRRISLGSLSTMYRRFSRGAEVAQAYREFMATYEELGHMERVPISELNNSHAWYLPHHAVLSFTHGSLKRIRVVFDASRKTHDKHCLNEFLLSGPALQRDLGLILLNWRRYEYVFTADIVKMFRQIHVSREDRDYQRILWAPDPDEPPIEYRLTTVTYGTACAPYLAIRTLLQLADEERSRFPRGSDCLKFNTYVDDIFAGADDLVEATAKRVELTEILNTAGFELDKWAANHSSLLPAHLNKCNAEKELDKDAPIKTLGIQWNPATDAFAFSSGARDKLTGTITKRVVLSNIARLFDPLGWLSPVTVNAKILMQDLWLLKYDWDTPLPADLRDQWLEYCDSLESLSQLSINRWLGSAIQDTVEIHGFSDASSRAYAAAVYIRINDGKGSFRVSLLAAKTKAAPVKTVSVPNLELCGAVLLVKLVRHLQQLDFLKQCPVYAWSDSQIVLSWLRKHPRFWKTFVANRVSYIQTELPSAIWAHVPTRDNPADLATRGVKPVELANNSQWWHGPVWLTTALENWPRASEVSQVLHLRESTAEPEILVRFSSLTRLVRVVAYCLRPINDLRGGKRKLVALPKFLTTEELRQAQITIIKLAQAAAFANEISILTSHKPLPKRSSLRKLFPIVDDKGVLRVGGRLANSELSNDSKNPPILSHASNLSRLIVEQAHAACLHGGPTLTASFVAQRAWILGRKRLVKSVIHRCVPCQRVQPHTAKQLMGDLPASRVTPARPFSIAGVDYAGPIQVRATKGRGHKSYKGYIALFICFVTRAIHLELVSDCTSASFIAAFRRFVGRRGVCRKLYSDNATNFHGADRELRDMFQAASTFYKSTASLLANDATDWKFIPPATPHFGGLWEAGVKSVKHHLKRIIGEHTLTFEELSTMLVEIEMCLNSRPLCPMSSSIDDLHALTPSHFLIGETSAMIPDEEPPNAPEHLLKRFNLLQRLRNNFWKRWSREYLQHLQERGKWKDTVDNFAVGQLVLVMDDRYPPSKWPLGRITDIHPGPDGIVRVATVKTATSIFRRHIARLSPLATSEECRTTFTEEH